MPIANKDPSSEIPKRLIKANSGKNKESITVKFVELASNTVPFNKEIAQIESFPIVKPVIGTFKE